jgi:hypothetical protein
MNRFWIAPGGSILGSPCPWAFDQNDFNTDGIDPLQDAEFVITGLAARLRSSAENHDSYTGKSGLRFGVKLISNLAL